MLFRKAVYLLMSGLMLFAACAYDTAQTNPKPSVAAPTSTAQTAQEEARPQRTPDVPYVPTPHEVVAEMLKMANVTKDDVVYDLGCGDGRIVIAAAKEYGARGVGIDINPERIKEARENASKAVVTDRVTFATQDLFETDLSNATVVTLYLLPAVNLKLRPKLFEELRPGARVVSHSFDMGDWKPDQTATVDGRKIYYWVMPQSKPKPTATR